MARDTAPRVDMAMRVVLALLVAFHLVVFAQAILNRLEWGVWGSDFAIFYRAAYLMGHGATDQVLRYHPPGDPELVTTWPGLERGYWYARLPFLTVLTAPLGFLPIKGAFILWSGILLLANLGTAFLLWRECGPRWGSLGAALVLALPLPVFLAGMAPPGQAQILEVWRWGWPSLTWPEFPSGIHWAIYAYGQDAPLLLLAITGGLLAARRGRPGLAGLALSLALAKPIVALVFPLILWSSSRRGALLLSLGVWTFALNFPFLYFPGLGPWEVWQAIKGYGPIAGPILMQLHNYLWIYGTLVSFMAVRGSGRKEARAHSSRKGEG